jgi:hypothetical protein
VLCPVCKGLGVSIATSLILRVFKVLGSTSRVKIEQRWFSQIEWEALDIEVGCTKVVKRQSLSKKSIIYYCFSKRSWTQWAIRVHCPNLYSRVSCRVLSLLSSAKTTDHIDHCRLLSCSVAPRLLITEQVTWRLAFWMPFHRAADYSLNACASVVTVVLCWLITRL